MSHSVPVLTHILLVKPGQPQLRNIIESGDLFTQWRVDVWVNCYSVTVNQQNATFGEHRVSDHKSDDRVGDEIFHGVPGDAPGTTEIRLQRKEVVSEVHPETGTMHSSRFPFL